MKNTGYYQCVLNKRTIGGIIELVSFIPTEYATIGNIIKLKENNVWIDGWVVVKVGEFSANPPDINKSVRQHRKRTGDSLPK